MIEATLMSDAFLVLLALCLPITVYFKVFKAENKEKETE